MLPAVTPETQSSILALNRSAGEPGDASVRRVGGEAFRALLERLRDRQEDGDPAASPDPRPGATPDRDTGDDSATDLPPESGEAEAAAPPDAALCAEPVPGPPPTERSNGFGEFLTLSDAEAATVPRPEAVVSPTVPRPPQEAMMQGRFALPPIADAAVRPGDGSGALSQPFVPFGAGAAAQAVKAFTPAQPESPQPVIGTAAAQGLGEGRGVGDTIIPAGRIADGPPESARSLPAAHFSAAGGAAELATQPLLTAGAIAPDGSAGSDPARPAFGPAVTNPAAAGFARNNGASESGYLETRLLNHPGINGYAQGATPLPISAGVAPASAAPTDGAARKRLTSAPVAAPGRTETSGPTQGRSSIPATDPIPAKTGAMQATLAIATRDTIPADWQADSALSDATDAALRIDGAPRPDAPGDTRPPAQPATPLAQRIAAQIGTALQSAEPSGGGGFELALEPAELGQVRLKLVSLDNTSLLIVHAERPETLDLMRRHIGALEQDLRALGHENLSLRFSGGDPGRQGAGGEAQTRTQNPAADTRAPPDSAAALSAPPPPRPGARDHLDLRL